MNEKLDAAIAYLRSRNIYIMDRGHSFVPTNAAKTDVSQTIRRYKQQVQGVPAIKQVRK